MVGCVFDVCCMFCMWLYRVGLGYTRCNGVAMDGAFAYMTTVVVSSAKIFAKSIHIQQNHPKICSSQKKVVSLGTEKDTTFFENTIFAKFINSNHI